MPGGPAGGNREQGCDLARERFAFAPQNPCDNNGPCGSERHPHFAKRLFYKTRNRFARQCFARCGQELNLDYSAKSERVYSSDTMGRVARFSCSVFGFLLFVATAIGQDEFTPEEKANVARGDRLQEIARLIQDPKNETEALATEAARLCGFVIWTEQREPVAQPLGTPRLGLALTKTELHAYSAMFRSGFRVKFGDVVAMFDYLLQKVGAKESCGPDMLKAMTLGNLTDNPSQELLAAFLNGLALEGSRAAEDQSRLFSFNENPTLDPIQLLILLRCGSEEMRAAAAKYQKKEPLWNFLVSAMPVFQQGLLPPQAEDGFTVVEQFGQGKALEKAMEVAIATQNLAQQQLLELIDMASKVGGVGMLLVMVSGGNMCLMGGVGWSD